MRKKNLFRVVVAFGGLFALLLVHHAEASCLAQLQHARRLREEAVEKVKSSSPDSHTKVWLAYVDASIFERNMSALEHLGELISGPNGEPTPLFLRILKRPLGVAALSSLTGEDLSHYLKSHNLSDTATFVMSAVVEKLFYFEEHEAIVPSQKVFEDKGLEVAEFATRMDFLKNLKLDSSGQGDFRFDQNLNRYFYYYSTEGRFDRVSLSMSLSSRSLSDIFPKAKVEVEETEVHDPLYNIGQMISSFKEPSPPGILRFRPLSSLWFYYLARRRASHFAFFEKELRIVMAAIVNSRGDMKKYQAMNFFKGLDAFYSQFLIRATEEQKHLFKVNMRHHFPSLLSHLSRESDEIVIDGDIVSPQTFARIANWCSKLELDEPAYVSGAQFEDPS